MVRMEVMIVNKKYNEVFINSIFINVYLNMFNIKSINYK